ncbi:MAG TPA: FAD-binding protein [Solirubrobacteraceae bacterium]|nr:FAD-binding protein [Solirubrobacteraceae bacterium]
MAVGSGAGGLSAAITADELGLSAVVLEKASVVGGVTAISHGLVWAPGNPLAAAAGIDDSREAALRYVEWMGAGLADESLLRNYLDHVTIVLDFLQEKAGVRWRVSTNVADAYWPEHDDACEEGRYVEVEPFSAPSLGAWADKVRVSPHVPFRMTVAEMFSPPSAEMSARVARRTEDDVRCAGPGLVAYLVKNVVDRDIPIHTDTRVDELIVDDNRVIGVKATRAGREFRVRARHGVLLATSGIDWNAELIKHHSQQMDARSVVPREVTGDHISLAGRVGAKLASVLPWAGFLGFQVPGDQFEGDDLWRQAAGVTGSPHALVVNRSGRRFGDESFPLSIDNALHVFDGTTQRHPNYPCWLIVDSQFTEKYPMGPIEPGESYPDGFAMQAETLDELAAAAGIDGDGLNDQVALFNGYADDGRDADFNRGGKAYSQMVSGDMDVVNPNLGAVSKAPYYAIPLTIVYTGIASVGLVADTRGRVTNYDDEPIAGLYVAGNSMAWLDTGAGYQAGMAIGRGLIYGHLAACDAAESARQAEVRQATVLTPR